MVAGNHVDVQVHDGMAGGGTVVEADVAAVRMVKLVDEITNSVDCSEEVELFFASCFRPGDDVAPWDDECVSRGDRKGVPNTDGERRFSQDAFGLDIAERAVRHGN